MQSHLLKTKAARQVADAIMANDMFTQGFSSQVLQSLRLAELRFLLTSSRIPS